MNYPKIVNIERVIEETDNIKTVIFPFKDKVNPGQFFMILIPDVDEIPMSVSYISDDHKGFTFRKVGNATSELYKLGEGDLIGIRGPLGNGFSLDGDKILFVGGGTGISALAPAVEKASSKTKEITVLIGVKSKKELFFEKRIKKTGVKLYVATDDGSYGYKGYASDLAESLLNEEIYDSVITCGPEAMMKKVVDLSLMMNIGVQASLERYIKCGMGLCGQCAICGGLRVCRDGPVFDGDVLKNCEEFGFYKRDASGRKVPV